MAHRKTGWFMNILDKTEFDDAEGRCCPSHYLPHKLPIGERITDEPCHIHAAQWRRAHHDFFCQILKCPHYRYMREKTNAVFDNSNSEV